MKKILIVVGTRPNFIKITQFKRLAVSHKIEVKIVHSGQHYDNKMATVFFEQFKMFPDFYLDISSSSPNTQIAETMLGLEKLFMEYNPDLILVVGDVNSTLAGALTANKMNLKLAHIESGLRSNDYTMPEEINRIITDKISDYCFITENSGTQNLLNEGKTLQQLFKVGNTMIDTMVAYEDEIDSSEILEKHNLRPDDFVLMTMHRPANVDYKEGLHKIIELIQVIIKDRKIIFPIHPRTRKRIDDLHLTSLFQNENLILTEPLDYFSFQKLVKTSKYIVTDSGGIQEESTFRKKPCLTFRANTERPSTIEEGTNTLMEFDVNEVKKYIFQIEKGTYKTGRVPELWDGNATERILKKIVEIL